ncbi:hypothetical protein P8A18_26455 [Streptomyces castrisilvae]|uniref:Uncharacterized protein n=1 Tax=Streptomyces castrisilvae TaxID=3033811 RepID=A0ABY9HQC6_9ACTN|nr:hypothetical protein [Streptomyces sp. Mut1]WLQ36753.1 hypothetical protein P8A18_26455 [Streptomyces sp. Mut1]
MRARELAASMSYRIEEAYALNGPGTRPARKRTATGRRAAAEQLITRLGVPPDRRRR